MFTMHRRTLLAAAIATTLLGACSKQAPAFKAVDITGAEYATGFNLTDHNGQKRTLADFKGKAVVIFFGYTQCPDVCPTSMTELAQAKQLLGPDGDKLQGLFISVDPERDTPEVMKAYMASFDPTFLALYAPAGELPEVARQFKIYYKKVDGPTPTSYTMDHAAGSYVYDTQGRIRLYHRYGSGAQALADDVKLLLAE
ncbi:SCO family protein [Hydrogenophaga sp.]|jgi:protein SCO1/2|uniref:SCO family protein n=1 Tax=Hydrogenophaga sp. TaxID=1904254 RepID=UPI0035B122A0